LIFAHFLFDQLLRAEEIIMADVFPFQGVLYNPEMIQNMAEVVTPPYDVISPREQELFYERHPNNVIRLILGQAQPGETGPSGIHRRAAEYFQRWLKAGILVQDRSRAFYLTSVTFPFGQGRVTRYGIIGCVRLEPFEKGIVLPHERTFSKVKSERLQLMQACHTNFSPIFGLYADGNGILQQLTDIARNQTADLDFTDDKNLGHKLWRISDPAVQAYVTESLKEQCIYIADGHHRYETALTYREWAKANTAGFDEHHPANFVMMSLSSLNDPGMVILPAHRLLQEVSGQDRETLIEKAGAYFRILSFPAEAGMEQALADFDGALNANADHNAIGVYIKGQSALKVLVLKDGVMGRLFADELPEALRDLDVNVLTRLLMIELMGFDQNRLDDATRIGYATSSRDAVDAVRNNQADVAFILNPTKIEQVQRVSGEGLIMPRKSTYFYPKVGSGLVINLLR
jgi:uncharacterized protein (DUF1015 family)